MATVECYGNRSYMAAWLHNEEGRDTELLCADGERVGAHSDFLVNISWFFSKLLKKGETRIVFPFTSSVVRAALQYLYTGSADIEEEDEPRLLQLLRLFDLREHSGMNVMFGFRF
jgi:hypothetical protein